MVHEGLLHRMQFVVLRQAFDGANLFARRLHGEHQAGAHRLAVDDHGAGAADAVLAADMGAGLAAVLADGVGQRAARLDGDGVIAAVDGEGDGGLVGQRNPPPPFGAGGGRGLPEPQPKTPVWILGPRSARLNAPLRAAPRGCAAASPAFRRSRRRTATARR